MNEIFFFSKMITFRLLKYNYKFGNAVYKIMFEINNVQLFNLHSKIFFNHFTFDIYNYKKKNKLQFCFYIYKEFSKEQYCILGYSIFRYNFFFSFFVFLIIFFKLALLRFFSYFFV